LTGGKRGVNKAGIAKRAYDKWSWCWKIVGELCDKKVHNPSWWTWNRQATLQCSDKTTNPQSIILEDWVRFNQQAVCTTTTKLISSFMLMIVTPHIQGPLPHSVSKPDTNRKPPTVEPKLAACRRFLSPVALSCMQLDT